MKQTEVGLIPDDWEVEKLEDVTSNIGDGIHTTPVYSDSGTFFFINGNNIKNGKVIISEETKRVSEKDSQKYSFPISDKTILMSINGTIGNVAFYNGENIVLGKSAAYLTANNQLNKFYLFHILQSDNVKEQFNNILTGSTIQNLGLSTIRTTLIPIPPSIEEQQRIAKALSDVDALIITTEKLIQKKMNIKQGTMQNLLTGKKRLPGFAKSTEYKQTELGLIPEDWEVKSLGEIAETFTGLTYSPKDVYEYGTLVLRSSNIKDGHLCYEDNVYVQMDIPDRAIVREGDILICVRNGSKALIGKSTQITKEASGLAFGAFMTVLRTEEIDQNFLLYVWQSDKVQKQVADNLGATINQITNADFNKFWITIPRDRKEQTAIANVLSSMDKEIETLNTKLEKYRNLKTAMMQQLLTGKIRLIK